MDALGGRLFFSFCVVCWLGWKMTNESFALRKGQTWPEFCGGGDGHGHRDAAADDDDDEDDDDDDDDDDDALAHSSDARKWCNIHATCHPVLEQSAINAGCSQRGSWHLCSAQCRRPRGSEASLNASTKLHNLHGHNVGSSDNNCHENP